MPFRVELTARAEADLRHIFQFIHAGDSDAAAIWFNGLEELVFSLANLPYRGPLTEHDAQLRSVLYGNKPHVYRILYRIDDRSERVVIRTIRHGARKPLPKP